LVKLREDVYRRLEEEAQKRGMTVTGLVRWLIEQFLAGNLEKVTQSSLPTVGNLDAIREVNDRLATLGNLVSDIAKRLETIETRLATLGNLEDAVKRLEEAVNRLPTVGNLGKVTQSRLATAETRLPTEGNQEKVTYSSLPTLGPYEEEVCRELERRWRRGERLRGRKFVAVALYRLYRFLVEAYRRLEQNPNVFTPEVPAQWVKRELGRDAEDWVQEVQRINLDKFESLRTQFRIYVFNDKVQLDPKGEVFDLDRPTEEIRRDVLEALKGLIADIVADIEDIASNIKLETESKVRETREERREVETHTEFRTGKEVVEEREPKTEEEEVGVVEAAEARGIPPYIVEAVFRLKESCKTVRDDLLECPMNCIKEVADYHGMDVERLWDEIEQVANEHGILVEFIKEKDRVRIMGDVVEFMTTLTKK